MVKMSILLILLILLPMVVAASDSELADDAAIDCSTLAEWSSPVAGYQLNLHHIFCGESGKRGRAKGFHSMPNGIPPSSYASAILADKANGAGVYTFEDVELIFDGRRYKKSFSSMFPNHCRAEQVMMSIIYSLQHSQGRCASPGWAMCGPNAPKQGGDEYCVGTDGSQFSIASAVLPRDKQKINTGFPIYAR